MIQRILFHDAFRCSNLVKQAPRTQNCVSIELKQLVQDMNFNWQLFWEICSSSVFSVRKHLHIPWSIFCTLHPPCFKQVTALFIKKNKTDIFHTFFNTFFIFWTIFTVFLILIKSYVIHKTVLFFLELRSEVSCHGLFDTEEIKYTHLSVLLFMPKWCNTDEAIYMSMFHLVLMNRSAH